VNNTVRQVGGALGVAILGSVLAVSYAAQLGTAVDALPAQLRDGASESIVGTLVAVREVQASGDEEAVQAAAELVEPAREAFVSAMHITAIGTTAATGIAVVVVLLWLPGRNRMVSVTS
jgi:hypothetical protein